MFSLYISLNKDGTSHSHIQFGGWDPEGIAPNETITVIKSTSGENWDLLFTNFVMSDELIDDGDF